MTRDTPLTELAATGVPSVIEKALAATVIEAALTVARAVVPLRSVTDAALAVQAALTPEKLTAVT